MDPIEEIANSIREWSRPRIREVLSGIDCDVGQLLAKQKAYSGARGAYLIACLIDTMIIRNFHYFSAESHLDVLEEYLSIYFDSPIGPFLIAAENAMMAKYQNCWEPMTESQIERWEFTGLSLDRLCELARQVGYVFLIEKADFYLPASSVSYFLENVEKEATRLRKAHVVNKLRELLPSKPVYFLEAVVRYAEETDRLAPLAQDPLTVARQLYAELAL